MSGLSPTQEKSSGLAPGRGSLMIAAGVYFLRNSASHQSRAGMLAIVGGTTKW